jgi:hypothetical protein
METYDGPAWRLISTLRGGLTILFRSRSKKRVKENLRLCLLEESTCDAAAIMSLMLS